MIYYDVIMLHIVANTNNTTLQHIKYNSIKDLFIFPHSFAYLLNLPRIYEFGIRLYFFDIIIDIVLEK